MKGRCVALSKAYHSRVWCHCGRGSLPAKWVLRTTTLWEGRATLASLKPYAGVQKFGENTTNPSTIPRFPPLCEAHPVCPTFPPQSSASLTSFGILLTRPNMSDFDEHQALFSMTSHSRPFPFGPLAERAHQRDTSWMAGRPIDANRVLPDLGLTGGSSVSDLFCTSFFYSGLWLY